MLVKEEGRDKDTKEEQSEKAQSQITSVPERTAELEI